VDGIAWLPNSSGMFLEYRSPEMSFRKQIKFQPYPSGILQNVTNDLNEYRNITVTTDGKTLATIQEQKSSAIYIGSSPTSWPGEIKMNPAPLTPGQSEGAWARWGVDGKIYFGDEAFHSFRMNPDGSSRARVPDRDTNAAYGTSCGPEAIVFAILRNNNLNLFRQDLDTREVKQMTSERDAESPVCSSDGKTVYYNDFFEGPAIKRVSTTGGSPAAIYAGAASYASLSPDGKRISFFQFSSAEGEHKNMIVVQDLDGGNRIMLSSAGVHQVQWAPDSRALVLEKTTGAGTSLFYQALDGSKPTQITHFDAEPLLVSAYSFSPDGKQIAMGRARVNDSDLVMFSNFR
jgi:Tol biopolymer transport system component